MTAAVSNLLQMLPNSTIEWNRSYLMGNETIFSQTFKGIFDRISPPTWINKRTKNSDINWPQDQSDHEIEAFCDLK